jgi:DnaJ-class molecular chaperone
MEQEAEVVPDAAGEVDRFYGGFVPEVLETPPVSDSTRAQRAGKDLYVELRLSHSEARIGGLVPVHIPVFRRCPVCSEGAEEQRLVCKACSGTGRITEDHMVEVTVPPRVRDGQTAQVAMEDVGLGATTLMVYVSVGGE